MAVPQTKREESVNPWLVLFSVALGFVMVVLDISILNIALPDLAGGLHANMSGIEWALIAYTLGLTGLVPIFGRISDVLGRKRLFVGGIALFALGSLLAAQSHTIAWLIGARLVQAVAGALITSNALAIITDTFPAGKRGVAMGVQAILISGGAALGPTLGGFLVTHYGWQAVFYVNVPVGALAVAVALWALPPLQTHRTLEPLDWAGALVLVGGFTAFLLGITKGQEWGWGSPLTVWLLVGGIFLLILFVLWERRVRYPLVDLTLFRIWEYSAGLLAGIFATLAMSGLMLLFPFFWQSLRGFSAQQTGILMLPLPLAILVVAPIAGSLSDRIGAKVISTLGLVTVMIGLFLVSRLTAQMSVWNVIWRLGVFGTGMGMFTAPNNNAVMSAVPARKRGIGSGLLGMSRYVGQSVGVAVAGTLFAHGMGQLAKQTAGGLPSPALFHQLASNPTMLELVSNQFVHAMSTVALWAVPLAGVGALLSWLRPKQNLAQLADGESPAD